jgi:hypothetical protein
MTHQPLRPTRCLLVALVGVLLFAAGCSSGGSSATQTPSATATATATATPTVTPTPSATATPTVAPTATPFVPPTVAVESGDSVRSCIERNLTPQLVISLSQNDDSLVNQVLTTCLQTQLPSELVFLLGPIIDTTSQCALDESKTLSNTDLVTLAGPDSDAKTAVVNRVTDDILSCTADHYHIPSSIFG